MENVLIGTAVMAAICSAIMTNPKRDTCDEPLAESLPFGLIAFALMLSSGFCGMMLLAENFVFGFICVVEYIAVWMIIRYFIQLPGKRNKKRIAEWERKEAERKERQRTCPHNNWQPYGHKRYDMAYGFDQDFICPDCGKIITRWPEWEGDK